MNEGRRAFLKIIFIGSGALLAEKILSPLLSFFSDNEPPKIKTISSSKTTFKNFKIVENKKILSVYDNSGEEIFQIDKGV